MESVKSATNRHYEALVSGLGKYSRAMFLNNANRNNVRYMDRGGMRSAEDVNSAMGRVYGHMALAIIVSMTVSYFVGTTPELRRFFFTGIAKWMVIFAPLVAILGVGYVLGAEPSMGTAQLCLHGFAALMGLSFAMFFAVFAMGSIVSSFMGAVVLFGVMSVYGYYTKQGLDSMGSFVKVGLISICIASIVNLFIGNSTMQMVISALAVVIFLGFTAYDTQKIREQISVDTSHVAEVRGALELYMDFINMFLSLLRLFGDKNQ
jgi:FtsH-binding integral membrane protein